MTMAGMTTVRKVLYYLLVVCFGLAMGWAWLLLAMHPGSM